MNKRLDFFRENKIKIIVPGFITLTILSIGLLASSVNAEEIGSYPPIVQKIAERFNLDVSEVEDVFDENRDERKADIYARFAEHLNDLVSEGKITEDQKNTILDKHQEIQNLMEETKILSHEEKRTKMQEIRSEFKSWIESAGIDLKLLGPMGGFGPHGMRKGFNDGFRDKPLMNEN